MEEGEADLPLPPVRPAAAASASASASASAENNKSQKPQFSGRIPSSPPADFRRDVQAAFKRHRPLSTMLSSFMPRRSAAVRGAVRCPSTSSADDAMNEGGHPVQITTLDNKKNPTPVALESQAYASSGPQSMSSIIPTAGVSTVDPLDARKARRKAVSHPTDEIDITGQESEKAFVFDSQKKVKFSVGKNVDSRDMDCNISNQMGESTNMDYYSKLQSLDNIEHGITIRSDGGNAVVFEPRSMDVDHQKHLGNFLSQPVTQASSVGPSLATTFVNSTSVPLITSTTCYSHGNQHNGVYDAQSLGAPQVITKSFNKEIPPSLCSSTVDVRYNHESSLTHRSATSMNAHVVSENCGSRGEQTASRMMENEISKDHMLGDRGKRSTANVTDARSQAPGTSTLDTKLDATKSEKQEKMVTDKGGSITRKKNHNVDAFFKVNGKFYQKLGKIGVGGSSEVHKVISSDCSIYALKKIKLKGRDYATAYGFCQEILYLNKLKGKNNIIQLIDYEVTDQVMLHEVLKGSKSNKNGVVKDEGYIYMVLEYGEIDLAHMLSQKWKEIDNLGQTIDENWLRFYWQQILLAVNTIHEERIVHSDLKPANFLLVKGSLKLIDFGIAKAIMSDTTNIQRDSQVGTLSYMSPEAFMCNENDANGNIIKCGRPSDIWSLGCILYQMVYGQTPFANYKTLMAKFKVITDPNHEIPYEPLPNPWLLDLMKKCLAWDKNERWRIPQLLEHPFLLPPVPQADQSPKLLQLIAEACENEDEASILFLRLQQLLHRDSSTPVTYQLVVRQTSDASRPLDLHSYIFSFQKPIQ